MKAKIYVGAKKYALYIGKKIIEKTLEFLSLPATFVSKKIQDLKNLTMWGQSVQNGTPTPTAPVEIESVGEKSKNLFDVNNNLLKGHYLFSTTGILTPSSDGSSDCMADYITAKPNTIYTLSRSFANGTFLRICAYDKNKNYLSTIANDVMTTQVSGITPSDTAYIRCSFGAIPDYSINVQLEEGSTATPYEPYGYKIPVEIATKGQNIFNKDKALISYTINAQGVIEPNDNFNCSNYVLVEVGKTYIRLDNTTPVGVAYHLFNADKVWLGSKTAPTTGLMVIDNPNCKYIVVALSKQYSLNTYQIIEGTTPKPYEPYQYTTTNIYLNEPLRKIGEYADTMSVDGTNVTVTRNVGNKVFNGTENYWTIASSGGNNFFSVLKTDIGTNSTILPSSSRNAISSRFDNGSGRVDLKFSIGGSYINFVYDALSYEIATWTNWLKDNNFEFVYPLATPTTETYTIENPIQLEEGTLTIDTDTVIKPSKINITGDIDNE